jgi:hypothetical protein
MFRFKLGPVRARRRDGSRSHKRVRGAAWLGLIVAAAVLVAAGTVGGGASGKSDKPVAVAKPAQASGFVTSSGPLDPAAAVRYWTRSRMAQAQPVPAPAVPNASGGAPAASSTESPHSGDGWAPSNIREGPIGGSATQEGIGSTQVECYRCPIPFTGWYYFPRYRTYPASTVAKIFFTQGAGNFVCSGSVLYTNVVDTAGHCVNQGNGGPWSTNVLVCPSYNAGINPAVGCWGAAGLTSWSQWTNAGGGIIEEDYGSITTSATGTVWNNQIGNITGWLGYCWGCGRDQDYWSLGYPQAPPFDGNYIVVCNSQYGYDDNVNPGWVPALTSIGCHMTGGSSGGPWIIGWAGNNWLNGHNDWKFNATPNAMQSPYYGSHWCAVTTAAGRNVGPC